MRDYLGNVRYVSGILQYTDYDPLGKIIYSSNLDKNVYLYEGKERIPDLAEEYESVYDFGARYYNPLYGRWFAPDPEKQFVNPYTYCGNNPIMLVDPDGRKVDPTAWKILTQFLRMYKSIYEEKESELASKINMSNDDAEIEELKKEQSEKQMYIDDLEELEEILGKMEDDEDLYFEFDVSNGPVIGVFKKDDKEIHVQYQTQSHAFHEIRHIGQSYDAGGLEFKDGWLKNASEINEQKTKNEINAYRSQLITGGPYKLPGANGEIININTIDDITPQNLYRVFAPNGRRAYPFAK